MFKQWTGKLNFERLKEILTLPEKQLQEFLVTELKELGWIIHIGRDKRGAIMYVYARYDGGLPVLLVAHTDTVHDLPPTDIYFDELDHSLSSWDGIGADDRAGVFAIVELLKKFRCDALFTSFEEKGLLGARVFLEDYKTNPKYHMLLELDTVGEGYAKFYNNGASDFHRYLLGFGYVKAAGGKKTDITVIGPAWQVNAANLSIGYYNPHKRNEQLYLECLEKSMGKVQQILAGPIPVFNYKIAGYD